MFLHDIKSIITTAIIQTKMLEKQSLYKIIFSVRPCSTRWGSQILQTEILLYNVTWTVVVGVNQVVHVVPVTDPSRLPRDAGATLHVPSTFGRWSLVFGGRQLYWSTWLQGEACRRNTTRVVKTWYCLSIACLRTSNGPRWTSVIPWVHDIGCRWIQCHVPCN